MKVSRYTSLALLQADKRMQEAAAKAALEKVNASAFPSTPVVDVVVEPTILEIKEQEVVEELLGIMTPPQPVGESDELPVVAPVVPVVEAPSIPAYFAASAPVVAVVKSSEDDGDISVDEDIPVFSRSSLDDEDSVRAIAREVGLSGWWNKKIDRLLEELNKSGHIALRD